MHPSVFNITNLFTLLRQQRRECEWIEYKKNDNDPKQIGKYISAMSNAACVHGKDYAYLIFGVDDETRNIIGTTVNLREQLVGRDDLEHHLLNNLVPKIQFTFHSEEIDGELIEIVKIPAAVDRPVSFSKRTWIRVNSINRELSTLPELERKIWINKLSKTYESRGLITVATIPEVLKLISFETFFDLLKIPLPSNQRGIMDRLVGERLVRQIGGSYEISICALLLFGKDLQSIDVVNRKVPRVIIYAGKDRTKTIRDYRGNKGYAVDFEQLVEFVTNQLPANEVIQTALRKEVTLYPSIAIREFIANTIVHQDLTVAGGPTIEIFSDRIEFENPGSPLIETSRFIDEYQSRNELMADLLRRMGICEEKGSGIDKSIAAVEVYQLRPPVFATKELHTKVTLFAAQGYKGMSREDRIRACYQHACLRYVSNSIMSNGSFRERLKLDKRQSATISRIIQDTIEEGLLKDADPDSGSKRYATYIPFWA